MKGSIDNLIDLIAKNFVFDWDTYPELKGVSEKERLEFTIRHSALHFSKTAGKVAAVSEDADHGGGLDVDVIKENVSKALINTLRLAELVGMSEDDLVKAVEEKCNIRKS